MTTQTILTITTITLPIIAGGAGFFLKSWIEKKREMLSEVNRERRAAYQIFVNMVVDLFAESKTAQGYNAKKSLAALHEFYKKNILFASPEVVISFSNYMQYLYSLSDDDAKKEDPLTQLKKLTLVLKAMRKDLGLDNKNLGEEGEVLIRALIRDFDALNQSQL